MQALLSSFRQRYKISISEGAESLDPAVRNALANEMEHTFVFNGGATMGVLSSSPSLGNSSSLAEDAEQQPEHHGGDNDEYSPPQQEGNTNTEQSLSLRNVEETVELVQKALKESLEKLVQYEKTEDFLACRIESYQNQLGGLRGHLVGQVVKLQVARKKSPEEDSKPPSSYKSNNVLSETEEETESIMSGAQCCAVEEIHSLTNGFCGDDYFSSPKQPMSEKEKERQKAYEEDQVLQSFLGCSESKPCAVDVEAEIQHTTAETKSSDFCALQNKISKYMTHRHSLGQVETSHEETLESIRQVKRRTIVLQRVEQDLLTKKEECQEFLEAAELLARRENNHDLNLFVHDDGDGDKKAEAAALSNANAADEMRDDPQIHIEEGLEMGPVTVTSAAKNVDISPTSEKLGTAIARPSGFDENEIL
jgi:hypothetical protein